jgi:hypothetical protein
MKWHYSRCGSLGGQGKACGNAERMRRDGKFYVGGTSGMDRAIRLFGYAQEPVRRL